MCRMMEERVMVRQYGDEQNTSGRNVDYTITCRHDGITMEVARTVVNKVLVDDV